MTFRFAIAIVKNQRERSCSISPATACGYLTGDGRCDSYFQRPRSCHEFIPGCDVCQRVYIGRGSPAAIAYGKAITVADKVLGLVDPLYRPRVFNFS